MLKFLYRFLYLRSKSDKVFLGRWGYHWEINRDIQKYYD